MYQIHSLTCIYYRFDTFLPCFIHLMQFSILITFYMKHIFFLHVYSHQSTSQSVQHAVAITITQSNIAATTYFFYANGIFIHQINMLSERGASQFSRKPITLNSYMNLLHMVDSGNIKCRECNSSSSKIARIRHVIIYEHNAKKSTVDF